MILLQSYYIQSKNKSYILYYILVYRENVNVGGKNVMSFDPMLCFGENYVHTDKINAPTDRVC